VCVCVCVCVCITYVFSRLMKNNEAHHPAAGKEADE